MSCYLLVGAGSHGRVVANLAAECGFWIDAYSDPRNCAWTGVSRVTEAAWEANHPGGNFFLGLGGVTPDRLVTRLQLFRRTVSSGLVAPCLVHETAIVAPNVQLGAGTIIMAGAIVQTDAELGNAVIVNTRAIVEHGSRIESGVHLAPGAIVLGNCIVGETTMIGASAVVLPGAELPAASNVRALSLWRG